MDLSIVIQDPSTCAELFGPTDSHLRSIRAAFGVRLAARDGSVHLSGKPESVAKAAQVLDILQKRLRTTPHLVDADITRAIEETDRSGDPSTAKSIDVFAGAKIVPKTSGQSAYVKAIYENDLTFCLGPAGSGKTYLAVAVAVSMLKCKEISRILLVRPAVEAGEKLGYLPGDIQAKVNPYLRPLFDAMHDMMGFDQIRRFMENDVIEVMPLAFMRGRTLNKAAIILDEAQNTTTSQMLMFLTRLGHDSKMIVTGDDSQSDLPPDQQSGVLDAVKRLAGIDRIAIIRLAQMDIVRHRLVQRVVEAYRAKA